MRQRITPLATENNERFLWPIVVNRLTAKPKSLHEPGERSSASFRKKILRLDYKTEKNSELLTLSDDMTTQLDNRSQCKQCQWVNKLI